MFFYDFLDYGQAQPRACGFVGNIGFKGVLQHLRGETFAVVGYGETDGGLVHQYLYVRFRLRIAFGCFGGVFEQVVQHLAHGGGVGFYPRGFGAEIGDELAGAAFVEH